MRRSTARTAFSDCRVYINGRGTIYKYSCCSCVVSDESAGTDKAAGTSYKARAARGCSSTRITGSAGAALSARSSLSAIAAKS